MKLKIKDLEELSSQIRQEIIEILLEAKSGHCAGPLGAVEQYVALYFSGILNYRPKEPDWPERDRVVISNGHYAPLIYTILAYAGYFDKSKLFTLRKLNSSLQGHPCRLSLKGIETSSGPVGEGLSQAIGMSLAAKMNKKNYQVYCLMGDGEHQCGNTWEAIMFAGKHQLDNLTVIIDRNNIQIDGFTEKVMPLEPLKEKYEAFNWKVLEVDGHNLEEIINALYKAKSVFVKPVAIICHTIPGKGVDFMEWDYFWHGKTPNKIEAEEALRQLRSLKGKIQSELD
ncbi:MAG TPA: transketolase [Candidatus Paceibacterota bacterium]|nr:transketolase [Candidatus Paceibacterota bacterium]HPP64824.1 transketolase [Candidatus Paceibacterota bacterium]